MFSKFTQLAKEVPSLQESVPLTLFEIKRDCERL